MKSWRFLEGTQCFPFLFLVLMFHASHASFYVEINIKYFMKLSFFTLRRVQRKL